jgi:hypothetical protein
MTQPVEIPDSLVQEALDAFWAVIVRHYPTATGGDLGFDVHIQLHLLARTVIQQWVYNNVPGPLAHTQLE